MKHLLSALLLASCATAATKKEPQKFLIVTQLLANGGPPATKVEYVDTKEQALDTLRNTMLLGDKEVWKCQKMQKFTKQRARSITFSHEEILDVK